MAFQSRIAKIGKRLVIVLGEETPDPMLSRIGKWLKENVLAAVISGLILAALSTILVFYIGQWLSPPQEKNHQPASEPKAMLR